MKIVGIETKPLFVPYKEPFRWAQGEITGASVVLVEISTDEGIVGYGECIGTPTAAGLQAFIAEAAVILSGQSPFDNTRLIMEAYRVMFQSQGTTSAPRFARQIFAGLEMAMWDIVGKARNSPVHQLLGGAVRDHVSYFGFPQGDTPDEIAREAESMANSGFDVIYVKVGRGDVLDLDIISETRKAIGPHKRLRVDPNEHWTGLRGARMLRRIKEFDIEFVEQPTHAESRAALTSARNLSSIPIAADQSVFTPFDVFDVCRYGAADLIVLGLHETGGLREFAKAASVAEAAGVDVCIHGLYESGITTCAGHQIALTLSNLDDGNQYMNHLLEWDVIDEPDLTLNAGILDAISRPGLGFQLDFDAVDRAAALHVERGLSR